MKRAVTREDYDYYLWLNDDTFIYVDCITSLLKVSEQMHDNAIVTGSCVDTKTKCKLTYGGEMQREQLQQELLMIRLCVL